MFRRSGPETLGAYAREGYSLIRDVKASTLEQYRIAADLFERWAGGPVPIDQIDEKSVSAFLRDYSATHAADTVRSKRNALLALWRGAADDQLCDEPVGRRVRRCTVPESVVTAWTRDEVQQLLQAAGKLKRWHRCGLRRSEWWPLAIRVAWDSGLRWADQVKIPVSAVRPDGWVSVRQGKTGKVSTFRFSRSTMSALAASLERCPRALVIPWPASGETFRDQVKTLVRQAGIRAGTWKWIRRGSGSDVELQERGAGHQHLGNTPRVFERAYADKTIIGRKIPSPRELLVEAFQRERQLPLFGDGAVGPGE
jgi:site-specific recombinase XerD